MGKYFYPSQSTNHGNIYFPKLKYVQSCCKPLNQLRTPFLNNCIFTYLSRIIQLFENSCPCTYKFCTLGCQSKNYN